MLSIILDHTIRNQQLKNNVARLSFYGFYGVLGGLVINDFIRLCFGDLDYKEMLEVLLAAFMIGAPYAHPKMIVAQRATNNVAMGVGMLIGTALAYFSEEKKGRKLLGIKTGNPFMDPKDIKNKKKGENIPPHYAAPLIRDDAHHKTKVDALKRHHDPHYIVGGVLEPPTHDEGVH